MTRKVEWQEVTVAVKSGSAKGSTITKSEKVAKYHKKPTIAARVIRHALKKVAGETVAREHTKKR